MAVDAGLYQSLTNRSHCWSLISLHQLFTQISNMFEMISKLLQLHSLSSSERRAYKYVWEFLAKCVCFCEKQTVTLLLSAVFTLAFWCLCPVSVGLWSLVSRSDFWHGWSTWKQTAEHPKNLIALSAATAGREGYCYICRSPPDQQKVNREV